MTTTPTLWGASGQVNSSSTGFQGMHKIVGLSNGNHLVVFADDSGTVGSGAGRDIVGVIYGPTGLIVQSLFQVNTNRNFDDEELPDIVADDNGGFYMAYEDRDANGQSIYLERFNDTGVRIDAIEVQADPGTEFVNSPSIARNASGNIMVSYQWSDGANDSARAKLLDANLNFIEQGPGNNGIVLRTDDDPTVSGEGVFNPETAALTNGNFVTVYREYDSDGGIELRGTNGTTGSSTFNTNVGTTGSNGVLDYDPQIAALTGGGFVVVWVEDDGSADNIMYAIYNNSGSQVKAPAAVVDTGNAYYAPDVVALKDGGFFVAAVDGTEGQIEGTRFDAAGNIVGGNMFDMVTVNSPQNPELDLTSDGRILLAWTDSLGNVRKEIWDPRDDVITADGTEEVITARSTEATSIIGTGQNEQFIGRNFDDTILGGFGNDTIGGGFGSDTADYSYSNPPVGPALINNWEIDLNAGTAIRRVLGVVQETDTLTSIENIIGSGWADTIIGTGASNTFTGGNGNDSLEGGGGSDTLEGDAGNDTLAGGFGTDSIDGGSGNDLIIQGDGENIDDVDGGGGIDTVDASAEDGTAITLTGLTGGTWTGIGGTRSITRIEHFIGTQLGDDLNADGANPSTIDGHDGDDTITGGTNFQRIIGGNGNDVIDGGFAAGSGVGDSITGDAGNDDITGANGADTIDGGSGNDTITSNGASDTINGGSGNDSINAGSGNDTVDGGLNNDTILGEDGNDSLIGDSGNDSLEGGIGNDTLEGGTNNDTLNGGDGDDVLRGGFSTDEINGGLGNDTIEIFNGEFSDNIVGGGGTDTLDLSARTDMGANVDLRLGTYTLQGPANTISSVEVVQGTQMDDTLRGTGLATLFGNDGNDTFDFRSGDGVPDFNGGAGTDTADFSSFPFTQMYIDLETGGYRFGTTVPGAFSGDLISVENYLGTGGDENILGSTAANAITTNGGNDTVIAGDGNDTITGDGGNDSVLAGTGQDSVLGGDGNDTLWGNGSNDTVIGNAGNDFLHGGDQNDLVQGGDGDDTVGGGNGADTVEGGAGNDEVNGGASADLLRGNDGNDTLLANTGEDTLYGGTGDDDVNGGDQNDTVYGNQGSDTVNGGFGNDAVYGGDDNDTVFGGFGNDGLFGGNGDDLQAAGAGTDTLYGNTGNDTLFGGDDNDLLYGNAGEDLLGGGNGADTLIGGEDSDRLIGDGGADVFRFLAVADTAVGAGDVIADFAQGTDVIDLAAIDALVSTGADDAFTFLGTAAHTGAGATLRYSNVAGNTYIYGDVDADAAGDFVIVLEGTYTLAASDFVL